MIGCEAFSQQSKTTIQKGDIIVSDFGRMVSYEELDDSLRARAGRILSVKRTGSISGNRLLIRGPDNKQYFIKISAHTGEVLWIAPANPFLVARYKS